jgi:hypothetical protein
MLQSNKYSLVKYNLSYIINYLYVTIITATIIWVPSQEY